MPEIAKPLEPSVERFGSVAPNVEEKGDRMRQWRQPSDDDFLRDFTGYLVGFLGRSPNTAIGYCGMVKRTADRLGKPILKVDSEDLMALTAALEWSPATNRAMIVAWRSADKFARMKGYAGRNGISSLQTPTVKKRKRPPMAVSEAHRLLAHIESPIQARVAYGGLFAGLRISESTSIKEDNWVGERLFVLGKGAKRRIVPVHPELARKRDLILSKRPASKTSAGVIFGRLRDRLDLRDIEGKPATPHTLRRTFATQCYAHGGKWEVVETLIGHEVGDTDLYITIGEDVFVDTVAPLEYNDGKPVQLSLDLGGGN